MSDFLGSDVVAGHEAGHATVAWVLGWDVEAVDLVPSRTLCRPPRSVGEAELEEQRLLIAAAGRAADISLCGTGHPWSLDDVAVCFELAGDLQQTGGTVKDRVDVAVAHAGQILTHYHHFHQRLTAELLEHRSLAPQQIQSALSAASPHPCPVAAGSHNP